MNTPPHSRSFLYLIMMLSIFLPLQAQEEESATKPAAEPAAQKEERITEITSDKLFFDYEQKKAIFTGNVQVTDPDLHLTSDKLVVTMTPEDEIERLDAEGKVEIKMEGLHSRSGKAVYTLGDGKVLLTENPQVSREGSVLTAKSITYWRLENRMEAGEGARVIMFREAQP